jgi:hypothetical protein
VVVHLGFTKDRKLYLGVYSGILQLIAGPGRSCFSGSSVTFWKQSPCVKSPPPSVSGLFLRVSSQETGTYVFSFMSFARECCVLS